MIVTRPETMGTRNEGRDATAFAAADWLCLAATPTFAIMALLTGVIGAGAPDMAATSACP